MLATKDSGQKHQITNNNYFQAVLKVDLMVHVKQILIFVLLWVGENLNIWQLNFYIYNDWYLCHWKS